MAGGRVIDGRSGRNRQRAFQAFAALLVQSQGVHDLRNRFVGCGGHPDEAQPLTPKIIELGTQGIGLAGLGIRGVHHALNLHDDLLADLLPDLIEDPVHAARMVVETLIAFGWAVAVAFGVLLASTRLLGNDRGLNAARGVGGALSIGGMLAIKWLVKHVPAGGGWLLLAVSAALVLTVLPVLTAGVAQRILIGEAAPVAPEPSWGSPSHWRRLRRTPAWAGIVGAVPAVIIAVTSPPSIRAIAIGLFVVLIAAVPVKSLLQPEFDVPLRLELAPERRRYLVRLYCTVGGPSWAVAMLLLALFGWRHPVWMAACAGLVVAAPLVYLVRRFAIRRILQTATIAATFAACLLY